jgi:hypothetical protein
VQPQRCPRAGCGNLLRMHSRAEHVLGSSTAPAPLPDVSFSA